MAVLQQLRTCKSLAMDGEWMVGFLDNVVALLCNTADDRYSPTVARGPYISSIRALWVWRRLWRIRRGRWRRFHSDNRYSFTVQHHGRRPAWDFVDYRVKFQI